MLLRRSTCGAAAFAGCMAMAAYALLGGLPGQRAAGTPAPDGVNRLAEAGATIGLVAIVIVVLLLIAGMIFIVVGRRRNRDDADEE